MKSKLGNLALALLIAFGLWVYVITSVSPGSEETIYGINVSLEGKAVLEEKGLMVTSVSTNSVDLRLSGTRRDLSKVNSANITLKADLSTIYEPGKHTLSYTVTYPGDVPNNAFVEESRDPDSIVVTVEKRITKEVPVKVKFAGSLPDGFMYDRENRVLDNPYVTVTGPASVVDTIDHAAIEVDLTDQRESISQTYAYSLCDQEGNGVDAVLITTNVEEIRLDLKIQQFRTLNLKCEIIPGGGAGVENARVSMSVDSIQVSGSEAALDALGDDLVIATFNLAEYPRSVTVTRPLNLPEGITNLSGVTEVTLGLSFEGLRTREFILDSIESQNIPEGLEAEIAAKQVKLEVRGPVELVSKLTEENIFAYIDFTGAEVGSTTYPIQIGFSNEFAALGVVSADSVKVTLTAVEDK